jgi:thimet oligopeptidase
MKLTSILLPLNAALLSFAFSHASADAAARPLIPLLKAEEIGPRCDDGLAALRKHVVAIEHEPKTQPGDAKKLFAEWNDLQMELEDLEGPVEMLSNVSPDKAVRTNSEVCLVKISQFSTSLFQSENLYRRFKTVKPGDAVETKLRKDMLDNFDDTGVSLPPKKRKRLKAIFDRMEVLSQEFARDLRDNNKKLAFTPEEVKGLPDDYLARAKRDDKGNYLLSFEYPDYIPFMEYADDSNARERYQFAFTNRGTPRNLAILREAMDLRHEIAHLFGLPSYAHYVLRRRMAKTPEAVYKFLDEVHDTVGKLEKDELEELRVYKSEKLNTPLKETKLERWDLAYWQRRLKQDRYSLDQNALRKYFPTDAAIPWVMDIASTLYGVSFKKVDVPVWHDSVEYYDVIDNKSGERIAGIYIDVIPREGKYSHAAAFGIRGSSTLANRTPISVLVANLNGKGLDSEELETLVHEFGHVMHGTLSHTRYVVQAGTSVERDFVEAPSQMFEEWARHKEPLQLLSHFCKQQCPTVTDELVQRMTAVHNYGRGIRYARQLLYASYDMAIHNSRPGDPLQTWIKMESATPIGYVKGTQFPGQFGHLMGGYAAGYYGYMWSEVLALDMLSRFNGELLNPEVGHLYREDILSRGSELSGDDLVYSFLGRKPNSKAFFDEILGKRLH